MLSLSSFSLIGIIAGGALWFASRYFHKSSSKLQLAETVLFLLMGFLFLLAFFEIGIPTPTAVSNFGSAKEEAIIPAFLMLLWGILLVWRMLRTENFGDNFGDNPDEKSLVCGQNLLQLGALGVMGTTDITLLLVFAFDVFCWSLSSQIRKDDAEDTRFQSFLERLVKSKAHCVQLFGSIFIWLGILIFSLSFQTISISEISLIQLEESATQFVLAQIGFVLLFAGVASQLQLLPFNWSALLNLQEMNFSRLLFSKSLLLAGGFLFLLRFFAETHHEMSVLFQTMAIVTTFFTLVACLAFIPSQRELKGLFYSLIGMHSSLVLALLGLAAWESQNPSRSLIANADWPGATGTAFWLVASMLIATVGIAAGMNGLKILQQHEVYPEEFSGWIKNDFPAASCWLICLATLVGMPMTVGFWSRASIFLIGLSTQNYNTVTSLYRFHEGYWMLTLYLIVATIPFVMIFFRYASAIVFEPSRKILNTKSSPLSQSVVLMCAVVCVGVGVLPGPFLGWIAEQNQSTVISTDDEMPIIDQKKQSNSEKSL